MIDQKDKPITVVIDQMTIDKFLIDCQNISLSKNGICGIDFEFDMNWGTKERYISLMQIILINDPMMYKDQSVIKPIYLLDPLRQLNDRQMQKLIEYIFCSNVIKIFHGSDSLDFPHIFRSILKNEKDKFVRFVNKSVDTRFLCELSKRLMRRIGSVDISDKKCSLYDALLAHKVIDDKLYSVLSNISSKINYNKKWIIGKLTPEQIKYSSLDVAFLFDLLANITNIIPESNHLLSIINRMYRFHIINRLEIIDISNKCKKYVESKNIQKDKLLFIDQKIMDRYLVDIVMNGKQLTVYMEDILSIDTLRKSLLFCLRAYMINDNTDLIDKYFSDSKIFSSISGHHTIIKLMNMIKEKNDKQVDKLVDCDP